MTDETLFLLASLAGRTVAFAAIEVGSVIEVDDVTPVPRVPPHIVGLYALRSRVLTVIDARVDLPAGRVTRTGPLDAVVLKIDGHGYALLVDEVLDVVTASAPSPVTALLGREWARIICGRITVQGVAIPVISPQALIDGRDALAA